MTFDTDLLQTIETPEDAANAVKIAVGSMTTAQKNSASGIDKATLFAEEAAMRANAEVATGTAIDLQDSSPSLGDVEVEAALQNAGITPQRAFRSRAIVDATAQTDGVSITTADVPVLDGVQVRLAKNVAIWVPTDREVGTIQASAPSKNTISVTLPKNSDMTVTIVLPSLSGNTRYQACVDENGNLVGGKYNPATGEIETKINASGTYHIIQNAKAFSDMQSKSTEMQEAVNLLAAKGIINGTNATTFSPDTSISRAQIATLVLRAISKLDANANGNFQDVTAANWFCSAAGSSKKYGIINGYQDNTFRGENTISKQEIVAITARILENEMRYQTPSNVSSLLSSYTDKASIADWVQTEAALAAQTNLILKRTDGAFAGNDTMTRGDAAIIIQRMFDKIW